MQSYHRNFLFNSPRAGFVAAAFGLVSLPAAATSATDIETRMLAQQGLAIGLASNVLVSQLLVLEQGLGTSKKCTKLPDGGSSRLISTATVSKTVTDAEVGIYFDKACTQPYIDAKAKITSSNTAYLISETAAYTGVKGQALGSMALSEKATIGKAGEVVIGLGTFTPSASAPVVSLGLTCTLPSSGTLVSCQGGIAQAFPTLNASLASVTPLKLTMGTGSGVTLKGIKSDRETGALGSLAIDEASKSSLGISGSSTAYGSDTANGAAAALTLFPPKPTHWQVVDTAHGAKFSLKLDSNATRDLTATITDTASAATLATIQLDQSGTGTIAYAGETTVPVTGWLLSD